MSDSLPPWLREVIADHGDAFTPVTLVAGAHLFDRGDAPDALYVVEEGAVHVYTGEPETAGAVARLGEGALVGEMGLLVGQPRMATVVAAEPTRLLRLPREAFEHLRRALPSLGRAVAEQAVPRWRRMLLAKAVENMFGDDVDLVTQHDLQARAAWHTLSSNEAICRQGDEGDSMYLIVSGRVVFEVERADGTFFVVGEAGAGEAVGEFSLLTGAPRSASVIAARETTYVEIDRALFSELVAAHPGVLYALTQQMAERQQRVNAHGLASLTPSTLTITLAPVSPALSIRPLADVLVAELGRLGSVRLISAERVDEALGAGTAGTSEHASLHAVLMQWLNEQEAEADILVFLADAEWTPWTRRCVSRADRVVFVAESGDDAALGETERRLADSESRCDRGLVLWHPPETEHPSGTARWLDLRPGYRHFHVRREDAAHTSRLARHLAGVAVGLVLAGGGARGWAHLGVFRALEELAIPVDYIGGSSFGALLGASRASEAPSDVLFKESEKYARNDVLFDRTFPIVAMNASHHLTAFCQDLYGEQRIEDLWLPFFAMAVNLTRGETVVLRRGLLWRAIRTSISVPGVFAPVVEDGMLMVDGGVLNNFPVDVMKAESGSDRIIGAAIKTVSGKAYTYDMETGMSGWRALWQRLNPFARSPRLPVLSRVLTQTLFVGSAPLSEQNTQLADLVIPLDIRASMLNFEPFRRIAEDGYEQSIDLLRAWAAEQSDLRDEASSEAAGRLRAVESAAQVPIVV